MSDTTSQKKKKILVVDHQPDTANQLRQSLSNDFEVRTVSSGHECLAEAEVFQPNLLILDLMLPNFESLDLLRVIRNEPELKDFGVIATSSQPVFADYQLAKANGALHYFKKPFSTDHLQSAVERYFVGDLTLNEFPMGEREASCTIYNPNLNLMTRYARLWGTRGSIPVAGLDYYRTGGNTSCMEVFDQKKLIIIDAGSGIRPLGDEVMNSSLDEIHLFIGHTHWDHIMGFPFFAPCFSSNFTIHIYSARSLGRSLKEVFTGMLHEDFFPIRLEELRANLVFHELIEGQPVTLGDIKIHNTFARHPGSTLMFKLESPSKTVGYATDNEFLAGYHGPPAAIESSSSLLDPYRNIVRFFSDCNLLIHEAQYFPDEYLHRVGWGHSSITTATVLVKEIEVKEWVITHHDPTHNDMVLQEKLALHKQILDEAQIDCTVSMAHDGISLAL